MMRTHRALGALALAATLAACNPSVETGSAAGTSSGTGSGGAPSTTSAQSSTTSATSTTATSSSTGGGEGGSTTSSGQGGGGQGGASGCVDDGACADPAAPHCDPTTGQCVPCLLDLDCALGFVCAEGHTCAPGCSETHACAPGLSCCGNACFDLDHDLLHCGACGLACPPLPQTILACEGGLCVAAACEAAYADCNGLLADGCEQNVLDGGPCLCAPGSTEPCYTGGPGTLGKGACQAGIQTCKLDGLGWSECQGQTLPSYELCGNGVDEDCNGVVDDVTDLDGDGWTACDGDCAEVAFGPYATAPKRINPGAFEVVGNGVDDDCDPSTPDQGPFATCSAEALVSPVTPIDLVKALDLCQFTELAPPLAQRKWGVIGASFLLADGSVPSAAQLAAMQSQQTAVLTHLGDKILPHRGPTMAGLSTGKMRDALAPDFVANVPGTDLGSASSPPASYLAAHNGALPANLGCNGACPSGAGAFDSVRLRLTLRVPTNAASFSYDFRFLSAEYGAHSCSPYNDGFLALFDSKAPGIPADGNVAFDAFNHPVLVNDLFFESCVSQGCSVCASGPGDLAGTGMELGGATHWLTTDAPVVAGEIIHIEWMIFDVTDGSGDSHVLLDNFRWNGFPCSNCGGDH
jgi:hypothetical protein